MRPPAWFRDNLLNPIPESVKNLRSIPLDEEIRPDLAVRFEIAPEDLDAIVRKYKLRKVKPEELKCPTDFFRHPYYFRWRAPTTFIRGQTSMAT